MDAITTPQAVSALTQSSSHNDLELAKVTQIIILPHFFCIQHGDYDC